MTILDHAKSASEKTGVPWDVIRGPSRQADIYRARVRVWAALRDMGYTVSEIGRATNRDHTAVCHGLNKAVRHAIVATRIERLEREVAELRGHVAEMKRREERFLTEPIEH